MGGTFDNTNISVVNDDNYHRTESVYPAHLPEIDSECASDVMSPCTLNTVTVSQNTYDILDKMDAGLYPIAASEIATKIISRQAI